MEKRQFQHFKKLDRGGYSILFLSHAKKNDVSGVFVRRVLALACSSKLRARVSNSSEDGKRRRSNEQRSSRPSCGVMGVIQFVSAPRPAAGLRRRCRIYRLTRQIHFFEPKSARQKK